ncbi:hypothetical protein [Candidatus Atelocyanobacterium thalassae]|jgi:hypothetical protein|uniref:Uncharacterized protein n=1 Tax=Atelocyanobacterium thalassa (isolate ALOHA) TaxID=1453429 RepID=D3EQK4_ATETH|nr:hypothetical protein [Candidatus Atelocyanobacterium thalassa]ADB95754.1 hypothetical protein UCYN_10790 [Candidatus Atelocyanobacterium thalassa isolate ALOHA]
MKDLEKYFIPNMCQFYLSVMANYGTTTQGNPKVVVCIKSY